MAMDVGAYLKIVEETLDEVMPQSSERPAVLYEAMRYAVGTGGKRIRPVICLAAAAAAGGDPFDARYAAAAIELLHNYTLVHDDLPAMDNDVERRGKPSVWAKFGEANAILAGDALQALAFRVAARSPRNVPAILDELGLRAVGVVRGQVEDLVLAKDKLSDAAADSRTIDFVYVHKTADLFVAAAAMGALAVGASDDAVDRLRRFALNLGLAFQYEDDLLDGDSPFEREATVELVRQTTASAVSALEGLPGDSSFLAAFARKLVGRDV